MQVDIRIKELKRIKASDIHPHPLNWRTHPQAQRDALKGALAELGYTDVCKVREYNGGYQMLDGHLRAETTPDMEIPCVVLDLDDAESKKMLLTHDPLTSLAETDEDNLRELVGQFETESEALRDMVDRLAATNSIVSEDDWRKEWQGMPEFEQEDATPLSVHVFFQNEEDRAAFGELLGQKVGKFMWYPKKPETERLDYVEE